MDKKSQRKRSEAAFIFAIILGLVLGIIIKRVRLGILLGVIIGGAIVFLGWLRTQKSDHER
jgi:Kef-type K+ transport system membrane component KefB